MSLALASSAPPTGAVVPMATAPASRAAGWIVGPSFDLLVFVLSAAVTLVPWVLVDHLGVAPFYVLAGVAVVSNGPHLASTWTRVYLDGRERGRRPVHYFVVPGLVGAGVLAFLLVDGFDSAWLRTVLFYWASWHFAAQCWGLLRIYQRKHGVVGTALALHEKALLFGGAAACVLRRIYTGPWALFGVPIWHPYPPAWVVNAGGVTVGLLAAAYVIGRVRAWRRGERVDLRRPLFIAATVGAFAVPFLLIRDGTAAFAAAACWHGIQYIGIVWFFNRNRYRDGYDARASLVSYVSQPGRFPLYFLALLAIVGAVYGALVAASRLAAATEWDLGAIGLLVWTSLTFAHYYLDGVIWKLRRDQTLVTRLQATA